MNQWAACSMEQFPVSPTRQQSVAEHFFKMETENAYLRPPAVNCDAGKQLFVVLKASIISEVF